MDGGVAVWKTQFQLNPSDFYLFGPFKWHLLGQRFVHDDFIVALIAWLWAFDQDSFVKGFSALVSPYDKCLLRCSLEK
jgi:hypothetical protein